MTQVLVIGSDTSSAASLREALLDAGASVTRVPDTVAAVEELPRGQYDCVAVVETRPLPDADRVETRLRSAGVGVPVVPVDGPDGTDRLLDAAADHRFEAVRDRRQRLRRLVAELEAVAADADDRDAVERNLADELVASGLYRAAWVGRWDGVREIVEPVAAAGVERASLRAVGRGTEATVAGRVATDWEPAVAGDGIDATAAVPLDADEPLGVLQVYAADVERIGEVERTLLADLGATVADSIDEEAVSPSDTGREPSDEVRVLGDTLAHELGNQLDAARVQLELAQERDETDHFGRVEEALERIESLASDATALARGEVELEPQQLSTAADEAWATVATRDATLSAEEGTVEADPDLLALLLENLFRNAVEHGSTSPRSETREDAVEHGSTSSRPEADDAVEHGSTNPRSEAHEDAVEHDSTSSRPEADDDAEHGDGEVTVSIGPLDASDGFYVADDGPGILESEREDVFEWGHTSSTGNGSGLAIASLVATRHGWAVDLGESEEGGARFEFS